ncbi:MAG: SCO family protein [Gemmatimonadota bacterium]
MNGRAGLAFVAALVDVLVLAACGNGEASEPPVYWDAPAFALVDQTGDTVRSGDLEGTVWVATFVFTNCAGVCPLITSRMAALRDSLGVEGLLGDEVRLVSFSVDPARDTPEVLRSYAGRFGGSPPSRWAFLTGTPADSIHALIQRGFKLTAVPMPPTGADTVGGYQVNHSPRLVLVDRHGRVRGTYDATEPAAMDSLRRDLGSLLRGRRQ